MSTKTIRDLEAMLEQVTKERDASKAKYEQDEERVRALNLVIEMMRVDAERQEEQAITPAKQLRNAMVEILQEAGHPLHYREIHNRLVARGLTVPGQDPNRNVGAHLSNDDRFDNSLGKAGEWGLASWNRPKGVVKLRDRIRDVSNSPVRSTEMNIRDRANQPIGSWLTEDDWQALAPDDTDVDESLGSNGTDEIPF